MLAAFCVCFEEDKSLMRVPIKRPARSMCFWPGRWKLQGLFVHAAGLEARLGFNGLNHASLLCWGVRQPSGLIWARRCRLPAETGRHMSCHLAHDHLRSHAAVDVSRKVRNGRSGNWHSHSHIHHAAFSLLHLSWLLQPITSDCPSGASLELKLVYEGHLNYGVFKGAWAVQIVLLNHSVQT